MDDLQKARAAWIAALEENQRLSIDRDRLRRENHELRIRPSERAVSGHDHGRACQRIRQNAISR